MTSAMKKKLRATGLWITTFVLMVIMCVPGLWVVLSAFRPNREILAKPPVWIPQNLTLDNFAKIFGFGQVGIAGEDGPAVAANLHSQVDFLFQVAFAATAASVAELPGALASTPVPSIWTASTARRSRSGRRMRGE